MSVNKNCLICQETVTVLNLQTNNTKSALNKILKNNPRKTGILTNIINKVKIVNKSHSENHQSYCQLCNLLLNKVDIIYGRIEHLKGELKNYERRILDRIKEEEVYIKVEVMDENEDGMESEIQGPSRISRKRVRDLWHETKTESDRDNNELNSEIGDNENENGQRKEDGENISDAVSMQSECLLGLKPSVPNNNNNNNDSSGKGKRQSISIGTKLEVIKDLKSGMRSVQVAKKYNISKSTISCIKANIDKIESNPIDKNRKRIKRSSLGFIDQELLDLIQSAKKENVKITSKFVLEKAQLIAKSNSIDINSDPNINLNSGWVDRFKRRYGIKFNSDTQEGAIEIPEKAFNEGESRLGAHFLVAGNEPFQVPKEEKKNNSDDGEESDDNNAMADKDTQLIDEDEDISDNEKDSENSDSNENEDEPEIDGLPKSTQNINEFNNIINHPSSSQQHLLSYSGDRSMEDRGQKFPQYEKVEEELLDWYNKAKEEDVQLNSVILQEKAITIGKKYDLDRAHFSIRFMNHFKKRHTILFKKQTDAIIDTSNNL